jgi:hypothetical protein
LQGRPSDDRLLILLCFGFALLIGLLLMEDPMRSSRKRFFVAQKVLKTMTARTE